ncbi:MAG: uracil-DNA glycosylase [Methylococcaceae bacterium]|nr:uracil-DNA glycosylase [Methylococcaceae bacterium]MCI0732535.1 uracil-DNA glycosylase [Methylococcaceae bacterium]
MNSVDEKLRLQYLDAMGIQVWQPRIPLPGRQSQPGSAVRIEQDPMAERGNRPGAGIDSSEERWQELEARVATCTACALHATRTRTVFGTGSHTAKWMVIGEAPGASEDQQGKPFVGRAGQLLTEMLRALGLRREEVFIANILKCRPPNNRDPKPGEVEACEGFLKQQVAMVKPKIILAAGRIAAQNLLKTDAPIGQLRGRVHRYGEIPLVVVYHPAYLLRSPLEKRKAWEDLQLAMSTVEAREK